MIPYEDREKNLEIEIEEDTSNLLQTLIEEVDRLGKQFKLFQEFCNKQVEFDQRILEKLDELDGKIGQ